MVGATGFLCDLLQFDDGLISKSELQSMDIVSVFMPTLAPLKMIKL